MPKRVIHRPERRSERDHMVQLVAGLPTKAAKIRKLGAAGYSRQAIADFLGISYQHVRNVLAQPRVSAGAYGTPPRTLAKGMAESPGSPYAVPVTEFMSDIGTARFQVDADGRITLTPELLALLQTAPGRILTARFEKGELILMSVDAAIRRARAAIPPWKPGEPLWSDKLIAERRAEAAREAEKYKRWRKRRS